MEISSEGIALIKKFEGCELKAYRCGSEERRVGKECRSRGWPEH